MAAALVLVVGFGVVQAFTGGDGKDDSPQAGGRRTSSTSSSAPPSSSPSASGTAGSAVAQAPRDKVTVDVARHRAELGPGHDRHRQQLFQGLLDGR